MKPQRGDYPSKGEPARLARNYRFHPDRLADLDAIAAHWNVTKTRAMEQLIEQGHRQLAQRSIFDETT